MVRLPNILLILNDHQAYYRHGWDGGVKPETPNYDKFSKEGMRFERAYSPTALCVPARRSIFTGLMPHNHGLMTNDEELHEKDADMFFQHLSGVGYDNYYFGKWHNGKAHLWDQGCKGFSLPGYGNPYESIIYHNYCKKFDIHEARCIVERSFENQISEDMEYDLRDIGAAAKISGTLLTPRESHEAFFLAYMACDELNRLKLSEKPWCMTVSFWGPHRPYLPNKEYRMLYDSSKIIKYGSFDSTLENKPITYSLEHNDGLHNGNGNLIKPNPIPWPVWQKDLACCYAHISEIDDAGGLILNELDRLNMSNDTFVIWTADHGDAVASQGGHATKGPYMTDELYRIPFAIRWNGIKEPGQTSQKLVSLIDIAPTILDLANTGFTRCADGLTLLPVIRGVRDQWRKTLMCEFNGLEKQEHFARMLVSERFKYIATKNDVSELYDLSGDPFSMTNLIGKNEMKAVIKKLESELIEWQKKTKDIIKM